ncbi:hypothetical protein [Ruegeria conchae]|uniref:hypothetical protein n=1 Tax=Ruegeria conchae TaxID=981384 RepID=UPI0029C8ECD7|nr:hypothetical protein [Ruegeria conchae]
MTKLSERLSDLSILIGDVEARAEAFFAESGDRRKQRIKALKDTLKRHQNQMESRIQSTESEIAVVWQDLAERLTERSEMARAQLVSTKTRADAHLADRCAAQLEQNAALALDFALVAMEDAELSALEAVDARLLADELARLSDLAKPLSD